MKVKQKNVCQTCRRRKLGCDGKNPACTQCVFSGLKCDGYPTNWTFLPNNTSTPSPSRRRRTQASTPVKSQATVQVMTKKLHAISAALLIPRQFSSPPNGDQLSALIVQNYVPGTERAPSIYNSDYAEPRICGSWVEVLSILPCLNTGSLVLTKAVKALAASILSRPNMANTNCSRSYHEAIHTLRKSLDVNGGGVRFDMIPTVMCLTLAELMIPDSTTAMAEHIKAVGLLFQVYGPGACQDGFLHKLFVGFRPLLTFQAILHRRPIFLSSPAWIETPFSTFDPSVMQQLLNEAVVLPSLLHQADSLHQNPDLKIEFSCIDKTLQSFLELTSRLENWEIMLYVDGSPPYWPYRSAKDTVIPLPLWYPNITMANVFTNLWALQIVCMTEIKRFETRISQNSKSDQGLGEIDTLILALARQIYSSMDYLLQDEMELFGPASAFFPLRVAFQTFEVDQSGYKEDIACIETIVKRLHRKGLLSARAFVFDE